MKKMGELSKQNCRLFTGNFYIFTLKAYTAQDPQAD